MSSIESKRYSVIYYKRSNKVHKGRGQTKFEGVLQVFKPPGCQVRLYNEDNDDEDDTANRKSNQHVSSCINRDISTAVFEGNGVQEDDVVVLPQVLFIMYRYIRMDHTLTLIFFQLV